MTVVRAFGSDREPRVLTSARGQPRKILHNGVELLGYTPAWRGVIRWNEFSQRPVCALRPPRDEGRLGQIGEREWAPCDWVDDHTALASSFLAFKGVDLGTQTVGQAAMAVARFEWNRFHPVRDWLTGLRWDPTQRLADDWLVRFAGCEDNQTVRDAGRMWLISSVARIMNPGCQVDHMLILEGGQGLGKTRLARALCHDRGWFSATPIQVGSKDAYQQVQGVQVYLLDEIDRMLSGYHASAIKDFITQTDDRFRIPYGTQPERFLRQCTFLGATNEHAYLEDTTGNRRYWPVRCGVTGPLDYQGLTDAREQLWAHAFALWQSGEQWWPTATQTRSLKAEQSDRETDDPWREAVLEWMRKEHPPLTGVTAGQITTRQVMKMALGLEAKDQTKKSASRVGSILRAAGWFEHRPRESNPNRLRFWHEPEATSAE